VYGEDDPDGARRIAADVGEAARLADALRRTDA
jgi:hypothetical protein